MSGGDGPEGRCEGGAVDIVKARKGACRPAAAKALTVVASYEFFCRVSNTNYPNSVFLLSITPFRIHQSG
jgi:hypothetical protein